MTKIAFAQCTYKEDFDQTKECINIVSPYVDVTLISHDKSLTEEQLRWFDDNKEKYKIITIDNEFKDDFSKLRNSYLQKAKDLGIDWMAVSDPDELYSEELAKNLRFLIEANDMEGYSTLCVPVIDLLDDIGDDNISWFDDLDKLKEYPAGYRQTDYYKQLLIYKIFPDLLYECTGVEKKAHETMTTQYKQKSINLRKEYFFTHKKTPIKIWRNAARNMFICGGGDNVGSKNRLWVELRQICGQIGINSWKEFENFVQEGINSFKPIEDTKDKDTKDYLGKLENFKKEFRLWLEIALKAIPTKEGIETRETAKWYFALHKDEIDQRIMDLIKKIPVTSKEIEIENFVTQIYYNTLGRHPDRTGLDNYVEKILKKVIKRSDLAIILRNSPEYKEKLGISSGIDDDKDKLKYEQIGDIRRIMIKIAFGQATYSRDFEETKECINRVSPFVDHTIISYDQSLSDDQITWLLENREKYRLQLVCYKWTDDMPAMRNSYLEKAKELGIEWLAVSDPDELFSEDLTKNLRSLIEKYDKEGYSILGVPVRDQFGIIENNSTEWLDDLEKLKEYPAEYRETEYWKPMLIFKVFPDIKYEGVGIEKNVHETLMTQYKQKIFNLPKEYFYVHKKNVIKIWRNAARNMFISGGGDNVGSKNRLWVELRQICGQMGINTWNEFERFVELGYYKWTDELELSSVTINTDLLGGKLKKEFKLWLEAALKALPTKEGTETREAAKWYFALHRDEADQKILDLIKTVPAISQESEIENFVTQTYYQILGRRPDRTGLDVYVQKIINKELKRHELADILRNSLEHKEKFSGVVSPSSIGIKNMKRPLYHSSSSDYKTKLSDEEKLKYDKIQKFVAQMYNRILGRSADILGLDYYTEAIMKKQVKPVDLSDIFRRSEEYSILHGNKGMSTVNAIGTSIVSPVNVMPSKRELKMVNLRSKEGHNTIALCIMGVKSELPMIKESINTMKNVVDEIYVQTDNFSEEDVEELKSIDSRIKIHVEKWKDNFSIYKNKAYSQATTEWILICDADEIPTKELADNLKSIINNSDRGNNYDMVSFDVIDIMTVNGKIIYENRNKSGKALLHWNIPSIYNGDLHVWIKNNYYPFKSIHSNTAYKHVKEKDSILERSARNVVIGGGGDTVKEKNDLWKELTNLREELGLNTWKETNEYLKKGDIDDRIIKNFQKQSEKEWKDEELKDLKKYYLKLHPNEEGRFG